MSGTEVIDISNQIWLASSEYTSMTSENLTSYKNDVNNLSSSLIPIELTYTLEAGKNYQITRDDFNNLFNVPTNHGFSQTSWSFKLIINGKLNILNSNQESYVRFSQAINNILYKRTIQVEEAGEFNSDCRINIAGSSTSMVASCSPFICSGTINFNKGVYVDDDLKFDVYLIVNEKGIINFNGGGRLHFITNNGIINIYNDTNILEQKKTFLQNGQLYIYSGVLHSNPVAASDFSHPLYNYYSLINTGTIYNQNIIKIMPTVYIKSAVAVTDFVLENSGGTIYNYPNATIKVVSSNTNRTHDQQFLDSFTNKNGIINNSGFISSSSPVNGGEGLPEYDICGTIFTVRRPVPNKTTDNIYDVTSITYSYQAIEYPVKGAITKLANIDGVSMINFRLNYNSGENFPLEYVLIKNIQETPFPPNEEGYIRVLGKFERPQYISTDASSHIIISSDLSMINTINFENNGKISNFGTFGVSGELSNNGTIEDAAGTVIYQTFTGTAITTSTATGSATGSTTGGAVGDPYIVPLNGVGVWKMPNFEGFSRMLQGIYKGKELTINAKTTFNSEEEIKETIKFATQGLEHLGVDCSHLLKTHKMFSKNESFIRELWIQYDNKETYLNLETLQMTGNDFTLNKTSEAAYLIDYNCHESNNIQVNIADDLFIIASNFDNPQVKTGFNIKGDTKSIQNPNGVLCNKLYKEDMIIKSITDIEPISQTQDRKPKGHSNEIYFTSDGEKMTKKINLY